MAVAFYLLLVAGHLGAFDVLYFHAYRCGLQKRPECQREVLWHTVRHVLYGTQFLVIANLRFHGAAISLLALLQMSMMGVIAFGFFARDFARWRSFGREHASAGPTRSTVG